MSVVGIASIYSLWDEWKWRCNYNVVIVIINNIVFTTIVVVAKINFHSSFGTKIQTNKPTVKVDNHRGEQVHYSSTNSVCQMIHNLCTNKASICSGIKSTVVASDPDYGLKGR